MWHSRVLYETSAGSGGRQPQTATSGVNHVPKVSWRAVLPCVI